MRNSGEVNNNDKKFPGIQFGKIDYSWMFLIKRREIKICERYSQNLIYFT